MNKMKVFSGLAIFVLMFAFAACNKEKEVDFTASDSKVVKNDEMAEAIFEEVGEISDQAYSRSSSGMKSVNDDDFRLGNCVNITLDTTVMPRLMVVDFGETNCLCRDGKWRRGQIIITFTGPFRRPGTVITHTFNNFYVNDNHVEGTKVRSNLIPNQNGHPAFSTVVNSTITLANDGGVISIQSDHLRTWIEGYTTRIWIDDVFLITGSGSHSHSNGGGFSRIILTPLRKQLSCPHFVSGTVKTTPASRPERILDYGDGACDNIATVTIGNRTFMIRLH